MIYLLAALIGIAAGLRAMVAPTVVSWAAGRGQLDLSAGWLAFLGYRWTPWILSVAAIGELVNDKLPGTPSRKVPPQFVVRILSGAVSGAAIATPSGNWAMGAIMGVVGAVIGTLGGAAIRGRLASAFRRDLPAALIEDAVAIVLAVAVVAWAGCLAA